MRSSSAAWGGVDLEELAALGLGPDTKPEAGAFSPWRWALGWLGAAARSILFLFCGRHCGLWGWLRGTRVS